MCALHVTLLIDFLMKEYQKQEQLHNNWARVRRENSFQIIIQDSIDLVAYKTVRVKRKFPFCQI